MTVELIYDGDCPNIAAARRQLLKAFAAAGITPQWREWDRSDPASPPYSQHFGSPTILVNGRDVAGEQSTTDSACCRVYATNGRYQEIPALQSVISALSQGQNTAKQINTHITTQKTGLAGILSMLPTVGLAALPKVFCPACWPAYSALLGAMGLGFVDYTPYMLPLTSAFLVIVVTMLGYNASQRRGYWPFFTSLVAAGIVLFGKFYFESDIALYIGIALLIAASIWNAWPLRSSAGSCSACNTRDQTEGGSQ